MGDHVKRCLDAQVAVLEAGVGAAVASVNAVCHPISGPTGTILLRAVREYEEALKEDE